MKNVVVFNEITGIGWQLDTNNPITYGREYLHKLIEYEKKPIAKRIQEARVSVTERYVPKGLSIFDIGAGTGSFVETMRKRGYKRAYGYDINKYSERRLLNKGIWLGIKDLPKNTFAAVTLWDSLEHMACPEDVIRKCREIVIVSLPIFKNFEKIEKNKHFRPNEHFFYFTSNGIKTWFYNQGFVCIEQNKDETKAGRENIGTYVFKRWTWAI